MRVPHRRRRRALLGAIATAIATTGCARPAPGAFGDTAPLDGADASSTPPGAGTEDAPYAPAMDPPPGPRATPGSVEQDAASAAGFDGGPVARPLADGMPSDAATGENPASVVWTTPSPGDLVITEVMFDPSGPEPQSEWFEVYNTTGTPLLLSGLTIEDGYPRTAVIAASPPVLAPARAYVLFVRDRAVAEASVVPAPPIVYEYGAGLAPNEGIVLANDASGSVSLWNGDLQVAGVPYGPWGMASPGQSIELATLLAEAGDQPTAWCLAQYPWAAGSDFGTPGAPSDCP